MIIIYLLIMSEEKRNAQLILCKLRANTEYLTNIVHEN